MNDCQDPYDTTISTIEERDIDNNNINNNNINDDHSLSQLDL